MFGKLRLSLCLLILVTGSESFGQAWTPLPLPLSMRGATFTTTVELSARCASVAVSSQGAKSCADPFSTPSFAQNQEIIQTLRPGQTLQALEVHYDPDGYAVRVDDGGGNSFWVFEPHAGESYLSYDGQPLRDSLHSIYSLHLAGDVAQALGGHEQCLYDPAVMNAPIPEPESQAPVQIPDFDEQAGASGNKFHPNCQGFIGPNGQYGEWGQLLADQIEDQPHLSIFLSDRVAQVQNMEVFCPNFTNLTKEQKTRFWVWTFMSIAHVESTCRAGVAAAAPSGEGYYAQGLLQMENLGESLDGMRSTWAGNPNPTSACQSSNIRANTEDNLRCGLDALSNTLQGFHTCAKQEAPGKPPVVAETCRPNILNNKWEKFRCLPGQCGHDAISNRLMTFEACGATR